MTLEESIKDVFQQRAEQTPDHQRLVNAVTAATSARRRPTRGVFALLATSVMGLVVAAVSVPLVVTSAPQPVQPPATTVVDTPTSTASSAPVTPPTNPGAPVMHYRPTWVPDGLVETSRSFAFGNDVMARQWGKPASTAHALLQVRTDTALTDLGTPRPGSAPPKVEWVTIDGNRGRLVQMGDEQAMVEWFVARDKVVTTGIRAIPDAYGTVLRMARSVRSDANTDFTPDVQFGWKPAGCQPAHYNASGAPEGVYVDLDAWGNDCTGLKVEILPMKRDTSGQLEQVTVRGKPGYYQTFGGNWGDIGVQLTDKYWLYLNAEGTKADLIRIVNELKISDLRFSWYKP